MRAQIARIMLWILLVMVSRSIDVYGQRLTPDCRDKKKIERLEVQTLYDREYGIPTEKPTKTNEVGKGKKGPNGYSVCLTIGLSCLAIVMILLLIAAPKEKKDKEN